MLVNKTSYALMSDGDSSTPASGSSSTESEPRHPTQNDSDSHDESSDGSYILSMCCECGQLEDRTVDIPILLCDGCGNECHLTCAKDQPNLTRVPEGSGTAPSAFGSRRKRTLLPLAVLIHVVSI